MSSDASGGFAHERRLAEWSLVAGGLIYALLFAYFEWSGAAAYALALIPLVLAYVVARTWLASAFVGLLPMYFVIGQMTADRHHGAPSLPIDHAMTLRPTWMLVYGSLYMCGFLLPLLVVRGRELFRQSLKAYLFVMVVSYAVFLAYPTIAPRDETLPVRDFATWSLRLFYDLDQPYGCFPSLHVAYSFVAAFACMRMHRGVGAAACVWAGLIGVSTIYTKQHYVVDAVAGAAIGVVAYLLFLRAGSRPIVCSLDQRLAPLRSLYAAGAYGVVIVLFWLAYQLGFGPVRG
jgi:membrane-associated phospholipid phosphatase